MARRSRRRGKTKTKPVIINNINTINSRAPIYFARDSKPRKKGSIVEFTAKISRHTKSSAQKMRMLREEAMLPTIGESEHP